MMLLPNKQFFTDLREQEVENYLQNNESIQCAVGNNLIPFGDAQNPTLHEYADGVDTMAFLTANY